MRKKTYTLRKYCKCFIRVNSTVQPDRSNQSFQRWNMPDKKRCSDLSIGAHVRGKRACRMPSNDPGLQAP